jgi:hypothetical protein
MSNEAPAEFNIQKTPSETMEAMNSSHATREQQGNGSLGSHTK